MMPPAVPDSGSSKQLRAPLLDLTAAEHEPDQIIFLLLGHLQTVVNTEHCCAFLQQEHWRPQELRGHFCQFSSSELSEVCAGAVATGALDCAVTPLFLPGETGGLRGTLALCLHGQLLGILVFDLPAGLPEPSSLQQQELRALASQGALALGLAQRSAQLRQSEARYQCLMGESPIAIAAGFIDGGLTEVNDAYLNLLGFTRQEYERGEMDWVVLTPPEYQEADNAAFQRAFEQGTSGHYEKEMLTKTGERIPLDLVLLRYDKGDRQRVVGYVHDLRLQRALQGQLAHHTLTLAQQAEQLQGQKAELQARTRVLEGFAALTHDLALDTEPYTLIERAQQFALTLLPSETFAVYYELEAGLWRLKSQVGDLGNPQLQAVLDAGLPFEGTTNLFRPWQTKQPYFQDAYLSADDTVPEETVQLQSTATLPLIVQGRVIGIFGIGLNVQQPWTLIDRVILESAVSSLGMALERAEQAQILQYHSRALERSNRELEQFAYIASHDLQEPLRTVASFTELLSRRLGEQVQDPKIDRYTEMITSATLRMQTLIQDLLTFARIGNQNKALEPVDVSVVLAKLQEDLHSLLQETGGQMIFGESPPVLGDAGQLRQLFQNLIGNALKFRSSDRLPVVKVTTEQAGHWVRFTVSDNGIGIMPDYHEKIFAVFQRLHQREKYEGNGIGLAIVRKIVEWHGGEISLESVPGAGTAFTLTLPLAQA